MNKLISANYWFGCDWWLCEVGYLGMRADQLSLACAGIYLWNTGHLRVTDPRRCSGFQQSNTIRADMSTSIWSDGSSDESDLYLADDDDSSQSDDDESSTSDTALDPFIPPDTSRRSRSDRSRSS